MVVGEWHPTADCETVQAVSDLKAFGVIKGNRPEGAHWRGSAFLKMDCVLVCAVKWFAGLVTEIVRVNRILWQVRAKAKLRDNGAFEVVGTYAPAFTLPSSGD